MAIFVNEILVVDDNEVTNFLYERTIKDENCCNKLSFCSSLKCALKHITENPTPDLILLDINLGAYTGFDFLEMWKKSPTLREKMAQTTVVILSTSSFPDDIERAKEYPEIRDYIVKPLTPEKLRDVLKLVPTSRPQHC